MPWLFSGNPGCVLGISKDAINRNVSRYKLESYEEFVTEVCKQSLAVTMQEPGPLEITVFRFRSLAGFGGIVLTAGPLKQSILMTSATCSR